MSSVGGIEADKSKIDLGTITRDQVDQNIVRCPDTDAAEKMIAVWCLLYLAHSVACS